jgi:hypothetical protein
LTRLFVALCLASGGATVHKNNKPPTQYGDGLTARPGRQEQPRRAPAGPQQNAASLFADPLFLQIQVGDVGRFAEKSHHTGVEILGPTEAILQTHSFIVDQTIPTMPQVRDIMGPEYLIRGVPTANFNKRPQSIVTLPYVFKVTGERAVSFGRKYFVIEPITK